jgi:hypothetical protein
MNGQLPVERTSQIDHVCISLETVKRIQEFLVEYTNFHFPHSFLLSSLLVLCM